MVESGAHRAEVAAMHLWDGHRNGEIAPPKFADVAKIVEIVVLKVSAIRTAIGHPEECREHQEQNHREALFHPLELPQEVEVAAAIGLLDVLQEHFAVSAFVVWRRRSKLMQPPFDLLRRHRQIDTPARSVQNYLIAVLD